MNWKLILLGAAAYWYFTRPKNGAAIAVTGGSIALPGAKPPLYGNPSAWKPICIDNCDPRQFPGATTPPIFNSSNGPVASTAMSLAHGSPPGSGGPMINGLAGYRVGSIW